jgi:hypothetical protein
MNGHTTKSHLTSTNNKTLHPHPHDWHRAIKVRKILFTCFFYISLKVRKEDVLMVMLC